MSEHNPNAWKDGFDAWQNGYDDTMYDGIDTSSEMPCKCGECMKAYGEGQQEAIKEIFGRGQSAQPLRAVDAAIPPSAEPLSGSNIVPAVESDTQPRP